jgi:hypothetical protein
VQTTKANWDSGEENVAKGGEWFGSLRRAAITGAARKAMRCWEVDNGLEKCSEAKTSSEGRLYRKWAE